MGGRRGTAAACLAILFIAACGGSPSPQEPPLPVSMNLTDSSSGFGLRLASRLLADPKANNVFIAPLSATLMLSMAASASAPAARESILKTLGLDPTTDPASQAKATIERLAKSDENAELALAQAVWAQQGLAMNPAYVERLRSDYRANIANLDFTSPGAPKVVNDWVAKATHHKISSLVDEFDRGTVAYLANASYFHALWTSEFDGVQKPVPFHSFSGAATVVPMMKRPKGVPTVVTPDYQAVVVPYKGGRFSMVILLPRQLLSPADYSRFLTPSTWSQVMGQLHAVAGPVFGGTKCQSVGCDGALVMPKVKLEYKAELLPTLMAMGMGTDLSLICVGCALSQVTQKTYLEVDEKGTTAASATGGAGGVSLPPTTVVDHPFALALIDNASDAPLLLGVIGDL